MLLILFAGQFRGLHDAGGGAGELGPHPGNEEQVGGQLMWVAMDG